VAPGIHIGHLKGMLTECAASCSVPHQAVRFRPSFFPFTEPSAEVDTTCPGCAGRGVPGKRKRADLRRFGLDRDRRLGDGASERFARTPATIPKHVTGWAFGVGIERIAMVRHEIDDIRVLFENDPVVLVLERLA
jgi:phenylalanyl-tRNA synthetase alpha chain